MGSRFTLRDYLSAFGDAGRRLVRNHGNWQAVKAELEAEAEWDRFIARHGLEDQPPQG